MAMCHIRSFGATREKIPVFISHSANSIGKGIYSTILPPAMGKFVGQTGLFILSMNTSLGERKLCIRINLVSYPARAEGLVNTYRDSLCGVVANVLDYEVFVSEFEFPSRFYIHF